MEATTTTPPTDPMSHLYCYRCLRSYEIDSSNQAESSDNFTCPQCHDSFVELVNPPPVQLPSSGQSQFRRVSFHDVNPQELFQSHGSLPHDLVSVIVQFYDLISNGNSSGSSPASSADLRLLTDYKVSQDDIDNHRSCPICMEEFELDEMTKKLPCAHYFHERCIMQWLSQRGTCPVCRSLLRPDSQRAPDRTSRPFDTQIFGQIPDYQISGEATIELPMSSSSRPTGMPSTVHNPLRIQHSRLDSLFAPFGQALGLPAVHFQPTNYPYVHAGPNVIPSIHGVPYLFSGSQTGQNVRSNRSSFSPQAFLAHPSYDPFRMPHYGFVPMDNTPLPPDAQIRAFGVSNPMHPFHYAPPRPASSYFSRPRRNARNTPSSTTAPQVSHLQSIPNTEATEPSEPQSPRNSIPRSPGIIRFLDRAPEMMPFAAAFRASRNASDPGTPDGAIIDSEPGVPPLPPSPDDAHFRQDQVD